MYMCLVCEISVSLICVLNIQKDKNNFSEMLKIRMEIRGRSAENDFETTIAKEREKKMGKTEFFCIAKCHYLNTRLPFLVWNT